MEHRQLRSAIFVLVLVALLVGSFFVGRGFADRQVSYAQGEGIPPAPADPNFSSFACTNVSNVAGGIDAWSKEIDSSVPLYGGND